MRKPNLSKETMESSFDASECWCPCQCGCSGEDELQPNGLCQGCIDGSHEVPPIGFTPNLNDLIELHQSIIDQYKETLEHDLTVQAILEEDL